MSKDILTAELVRELLSYDPETGIFKRRKTGAATGHKRNDGYIRMRIGKSSCYAHRLAWLYVTGEHPEHSIDHINGDRSDNRFSNLRDVPMLHNTQNKRSSNSNSTTGLLGVAKSRTKWAAQICVSGKRQHIGTFKTPEEAHLAYVAAKRRMHVGCTL